MYVQDVWEVSGQGGYFSWSASGDGLMRKERFDGGIFQCGAEIAIGPL
jgi:hypothetical protein